MIGHSMGGLPITAAEARPENVKALVYLAAYLVPNGESLMGFSSSFAQANHDAEVAISEEYIAPIEDGLGLRFDPEGLGTSFCGDHPLEQIAYAKASVSEVIALFSLMEPVTEANFGSVPRYYNETLQDRAVVHPFQVAMVEVMPVKRAFSLDTGRSPDFSAPEALAEHLLTMSRLADEVQ